MCLILCFPTVDPLHEHVAYGYIAWMSGWTCNKPNSCHPYFWNIPFLICSSNIETGLFMFETLMFCQYLERKSWPWTQEVSRNRSFSSRPVHGCTQSCGLSGHPFVADTESEMYLTCQHKLCSSSALYFLAYDLASSRTPLTLVFILNPIHKSSENLQGLSLSTLLSLLQFLCFLTRMRGIEHRGW